jgi:protein TonB
MRTQVWVLMTSSSNWGWQLNVAAARAVRATSWPNAAPPGRWLPCAKSPAIQRARHGLPDPDWRQPDCRDGIDLVDFPAMTSFAMGAPLPPPFLNTFKGMSRNTVIATCVVLFHVFALWALQSGLLRRAIEVIVPVQMLSDFVEPPAPKVVPPPPAPPTPVKQPVVQTKVAALPPPPQPIAIADTTPSPNAPTGVTTPQPPAPPIAAQVAVAPPAPPAPPAQPRVELPSSDADYLQNPRPVYPPMSKRLNEQGQVIHSVLIGVDGLPISAKLVKSSGFDRLDQAAYKAVMSWRYVPGKRNGVPTPMSYNAPINWVLE